MVIGHKCVNVTQSFSEFDFFHITSDDTLLDAVTVVEI